MKRRKTIYLLTVVGTLTVFLVTSYIVSASKSTENSLYFPIISKQVLKISPLVHFAPNQYWDAQIGEVINLSANQVFSVSLEALIYNWNTRTYYTETIQTMLSAILPEQAAPFAIDYSDGWEEVISVSFDTVTELDAINYLPVTIVSSEFGPCSTYWTYIHGVVRNDNDVPLQNIRVAVWRLTEDNSAYVMGHVEDPILNPGEETDFYTSLFPYNTCFTPNPPPINPPPEDIVNYNISGQGTTVP